MDTDSPKYWCEKMQEVVEGTQVCPNQVPLVAIMGEYRWVWRRDAVVEEISSHSNSDGCETIGLWLKGAEINGPGKVQRSRITGIFDLYLFHAKINGLRAVKGLTNVYEIKDLDISEGDFLPYGNMIRVLNIKDDDGYPFLEFEWNGGWEGCCPCIGTLIAKKDTGEYEWEGLTDEERDRLGIDVDGKELEQRIKKEKEAEENENGEESKLTTETGVKRAANDSGHSEDERDTKKIKVE